MRSLPYFPVADSLGNYVYGASQVLFFFTALLTLFGRSCCVPGAGLDNMANTAYTLGTIGILFSAYEIIFTADGSNQFLGYFAKCGGLNLVGCGSCPLYSRTGYIETPTTIIIRKGSCATV
jgi:hypothetical protein